ncbi:MAG: DUF2148 domain-containing protein [Candidatus Margulisiibacteriota bacterium]
MIQDKEFMEKAIISIAEGMCLAARTAPKAKGIDLLETAIFISDDILKLSSKMKEIGERESNQTFLRDSENIKSAAAVVIIGTKKKAIGLRYCSFCGWPNCAESEKAGAVCAYNSGDLGIAIGSAVSFAMDHRVDNRVMYSVGKTIVENKLLGDEVVIAYGIPLSVSGKNPFFDRR